MSQPGARRVLRLQRAILMEHLEGTDNEPEKETMDNPTSNHYSSGNAEDPLSQNFRSEKKDLGVVPVEKLERFYDEGSESDGDSSTWLLSQHMEQEEPQPHSMFEADMEPEVPIFPDKVKEEARKVNENGEDFNSDMDSNEEEVPEDDSSHESESSSNSSESDDDTSPWPRPCPRPPCKLSFNTKILLEAHLTLHGDFSCQFCPLVKDFAPHLALHELQHSKKIPTSKPQKSFHCPRCLPGETSLDSKIDYIQHFLKTHLSFGAQKKKHVCDICGIGIGSNCNLKRHHRFYHDTKGRSPSQIHNCPQCPAHFLQKHQLLRHRFLAHYKTKCPQCSKIFNYRYPHNFWSHLKLCGNEGSRRDKSEVKMEGECSESTGALSKRFACGSCDRSFVFEKLLRRHQRMQHGRVEVKTKWKCGVDGCQQDFEFQRALSMHKRMAHGATGKKTGARKTTTQEDC